MIALFAPGINDRRPSLGKGAAMGGSACQAVLGATLTVSNSGLDRIPVERRATAVYLAGMRAVGFIA